MTGDRLYLIHILECVERIERYTAGGRDAFFADPKTQDAVIRNLQVLGESVRRLSGEVAQAAPGIRWRAIAGLPSVLVHEYLGVNLVRVWEILARDLPALKTAVARILREAG
ncbi:MAG: DUF86 domain-containing protein [Acidobacteria bacterium]|nr:DUF86 domain-containing protein [Acidobacteriota bacterium]